MIFLSPNSPRYLLPTISLGPLAVPSLSDGAKQTTFHARVGLPSVDGQAQVLRCERARQRRSLPHRPKYRHGSVPSLLPHRRQSMPRGAVRPTCRRHPRTCDISGCLVPAHCRPGRRHHHASPAPRRRLEQRRAGRWVSLPRRTRLSHHRTLWALACHLPPWPR